MVEKKPLMQWKDGKATITFPDDRVILFIVIKRPGKEPAALPLQMTLEERDSMFRTPGDWKTTWDQIEKKVLNQLTQKNSHV